MARRERLLELTPAQVRLLDALIARRGKVVSRVALLDAMMVDCPEKRRPKPEVVMVQVHYLRKIIEASGQSRF